jgi:hypothetical protein
MKNQKLTIRDFTYVNDEVIGKSWQNGPYAILVGRNSYAVTYQGRTIAWNLRDILSAIEVVAKHESGRKALEAK